MGMVAVIGLVWAEEEVVVEAVWVVVVGVSGGLVSVVLFAAAASCPVAVVLV